jgi:hypothetical protein
MCAGRAASKYLNGAVCRFVTRALQLELHDTLPYSEDSEDG